MSHYEMGYQQQEVLAAKRTCECLGGESCSHDGPCEEWPSEGVYCGLCYCNARAEADAQSSDWRDE